MTNFIDQSRAKDQPSWSSDAASEKTVPVAETSEQSEKGDLF